MLHDSYVMEKIVGYSNGNIHILL